MQKSPPSSYLYKIELKSFAGNVVQGVREDDPKYARDAFEYLVNRGDLDGQKYEATLTYRRRVLARHNFMTEPDQKNHWRSRLDCIKWPQARPGRPSTLIDGQRVNVYLDDESLQKAFILGDGNISQGIRLALSIVHSGMQANTQSQERLCIAPSMSGVL